MSADKQAQIVDPDPSAKTRVSQDADPTAAGVQATLGGSDPEIDGEPHRRLDGIVDVATASEGSKFHLQRCPLCPETVFTDAASVDNHIASHEPGEFGLGRREYATIPPELQYDDPEAVFGGWSE